MLNFAPLPEHAPFSTSRVDKRESVELVVTHCVSYTMNIDSVIAIQLHFVVYSIWLQPTTLVRSHHNVYLDTSINEK